MVNEARKLKIFLNMTYGSGREIILDGLAVERFGQFLQSRFVLIFRPDG
jgi:hypothetical protein